MLDSVGEVSVVQMVVKMSYMKKPCMRWWWVVCWAIGCIKPLTEKKSCH